MTGTFTVLVTGSRNWTDEAGLSDVLNEHLHAALSEGKVFRLLYGDCPTGADAMAKNWGVRNAHLGVLVREEKADWNRPCDENCYHRPSSRCPAAGPIRNQRMVDVGAGVCVAFLFPDSRGTQDCVRRAKKANIPVQTIVGTR